MIKPNVYESPKSTMAQLLSGLNREITNVVELQHYLDLKEMVYMVMKIERQLKYKWVSRGISHSTPQFSSRWPKKDERKKFEEKKDKSTSIDPRGNSKTPVSNQKHSSIKFFRCLEVVYITSNCLNKKVILMENNGEVESASGYISDNDSTTSFEDCEDNVVTLL